jgi:superfamily II DNA/RNA helicase
VVPVESWEDFNFKEEVLRGIFAKGFEKPSKCVAAPPAPPAARMHVP